MDSIVKKGDIVSAPNGKMIDPTTREAYEERAVQVEKPSKWLDAQIEFGKMTIDRDVSAELKARREQRFQIVDKRLNERTVAATPSAPAQAPQEPTKPQADGGGSGNASGAAPGPAAPSQPATPPGPAGTQSGGTSSDPVKK